MSSPQLSSNLNYEIKEFLGSGSSGTVYKILVKADQKEYAVKQVDRAAAIDDAKMENMIFRKGIPNVLKSFGSYHDKNKPMYMFSTELMETTLEKLIESQGPLEWNKFCPIFSDMLSGPNFLPLH